MACQFLRESYRRGYIEPTFLLSLAFISLFWVDSVNSATVTISEAWGNLAAGTNAEFHAVIQSSNATRGNLQFSVTIGHQSIVRREIEVAVDVGRPTVVPIRFTVPSLKDDVVIKAILTAAFQQQSVGPNKGVSSIEKTLWFFAANPFAGHEASLKDKKISLFDPKGKTRKIFEQVGIPFTLVPRPDAIPSIKEGLLIIGEGLSLQDFKPLAEMCLAAAGQGVPVLCLALKAGQFRLMDSNDKSLAFPCAVSFRHNDIITSLDKRLDANAWPPDGIMAANTINIIGERGPILGEVLDRTGEWPWIEMGFSDTTKVIFCQFNIMEKWGASPTSCYLLAALLDYLVKKQPLEKSGLLLQ